MKHCNRYILPLRNVEVAEMVSELRSVTPRFMAFSALCKRAVEPRQHERGAYFCVCNLRQDNGIVLRRHRVSTVYTVSVMFVHSKQLLRCQVQAFFNLLCSCTLLRRNRPLTAVPTATSFFLNAGGITGHPQHLEPNFQRLSEPWALKNPPPDGPSAHRLTPDPNLHVKRCPQQLLTPPRPLHGDPNCSPGLRKLEGCAACFAR